MNEITKNIRPIYSELQGYLNQAPGIGEHGNSVARDNTLWEQYNSAIDELNTVSGADFNKFKVTGLKQGQFGTHIVVSELRIKLGGLIARLHGTYFSDEQAPFIGMPSTTINLSNQQNQHQQQSVFVDLAILLDKKIAAMPEGNEKSFLSELRAGIGTVKDFASLILLIADLGAKYGITLPLLSKLFN